MSIGHSNPSITTTASAIRAATASPDGYRAIELFVQNNHATAVLYLGGTSSVSSTSHGWKLPPGAGVIIRCGDGDALYAVASANIAAPDVAVLVTAYTK